MKLRITAAWSDDWNSDMQDILLEQLELFGFENIEITEEDDE